MKKHLVFIRKSFSLIEALLAASIMSVIALSLYSAFYTGILSYRRLDSSFTAYQNARASLSRIETDLKNAFSYSDADSKFSGASQTLNFFSVLDSYEGVKSQPGVCFIKYEFKDSRLERTCLKGQDALISPAKETVLAQDLCASVKEISFQYAFALAANSQHYQWSEVWPREENKGVLLPLAIKIKLVLLENSGRQDKDTVEFTKVISLPPAQGL
jgi:type II secretory pathway component PulJ